MNNLFLRKKVHRGLFKLNMFYNKLLFKYKNNLKKNIIKINKNLYE